MKVRGLMNKAVNIDSGLQKIVKAKMVTNLQYRSTPQLFYG